MWRILPHLKMVNSHTKFCWNCSHLLSTHIFFCSNCNSIQKPEKMNHFEFFSLPLIYQIDYQLLEKKFFELQSSLHPDKFWNASEKEKLYSQILSAEINLAYNCLKDPVKRANTLLKILANLEVKENSCNDKKILIEIIDLQEEMQNLQTKREKKIFLKRIDFLMQQNFKKIENEFKSKNYLEAMNINIKLLYLKKIKNNQIFLQ